ncbi:hypothetical protein HHJ39_00050 [Escherichia coli]|nr:hypothetical protein HHJ39_00050 [Escherichia coli]
MELVTIKASMLNNIFAKPSYQDVIDYYPLPHSPRYRILASCQALEVGAAVAAPGNLNQVGD